MGKRRRPACGCLFAPRRNIPQQRHCSKSNCQSTCRRPWQRQKVKSEPDYRANQAAAQQRWRDRHPDDQGGYRHSHPRAPHEMANDNA